MQLLIKEQKDVIEALKEQSMEQQAQIEDMEIQMSH